MDQAFVGKSSVSAQIETPNYVMVLCNQITDAVSRLSQSQPQIVQSLQLHEVHEAGVRDVLIWTNMKRLQTGKLDLGERFQARVPGRTKTLLQMSLPNTPSDHPAPTPPAVLPPASTRTAGSGGAGDPDEVATGHGRVASQPGMRSR